jgi:hypothetical protein
MHLERAERVLIVSRDEDDRHAAADELEHFEAAQLRHLHVQKQQVGREFADRLDGFEPVRALGDDLHARMRAEELADDGARERFIVHDHDAQQGLCHWGDGIVVSASRGKDMSTRQRPPASDAATWALSP